MEGRIQARYRFTIEAGEVGVYGKLEPRTFGEGQRPVFVKREAQVFRRVSN